MTGLDLGCDRGKLGLQGFDLGLADRIAKPGRELVAPDQPGAVELDVEVAEHAARLQTARPGLEAVELASNVGATDGSADRGSNDNVWQDTARQQRAQHT